MSFCPPPVAQADDAAAAALPAAPARAPAAFEAGWHSATASAPRDTLSTVAATSAADDLRLTLTAAPTQVEPGDVVTYTATLVNAGDAALTTIVLTDTLPDGLVYVAQSAVGFDYDPSAQQLTWRIATLAPGATLTGSFQARVQGLALGTTVTNIVAATSADEPGVVQAAATIEVVSPRSNELRVTPTQGGLLRTTDRRVELRVPPGAVERPTRIIYTPRSDLTPLPPYILAPFALEAQDESGQAVRQFAAALTLRLAYTPVQSSTSVYFETGLFTLDEDRGQWLAIPAELDQAAGRLQATLTHFSIYSEGNTSYVLERMSSLRGAQTNLFTRAIGYAYPFDLPPGRGGLTPRLGLSYSSANHTPNSGHFSYPGFGWELMGADSIYTAPGDENLERPTLSLQGATYSLRKTTGNVWFVKENPFLKVEKITWGTWYVWTPDGVKYTFSAANAGTYYWKLCTPPDTPFKRYVRVPLVSIQDLAGNTVSFTWQTESETTPQYDPNDPNTWRTDGCYNMTYGRALRLTALSYNGGAVQMTLNYTTRDDRPEGYDNTHWRFYTEQRLTEVLVQAKENGAGTLHTVRSYALGQSSGPATALSQKVLNLDWLEERSAGGSVLPRTEFTYTNNCFDSDNKFGALNLVRNGYGGEVAFQSQNRDSYGPNPHVVSSRTERDGIDGTPDAVWSYTSSAWDETGATVPPLLGGPLAQGYSQVTVTLPTGTVERYDFIVLSTVSNGNKVDHLAGLETQRVISSGAVELAKMVTSWVSTTQSLPVTDTVSSEELRPRFVYAAASETYQDGQRQVRTENEYQTARQGSSGLQFGNLTEQREYAGTVSGWEALPTRTRYFWYYPNTSAWLINKLAFTHLYQVCYGCTGAALVGASLYYYDSAASETTPPTQGRLTKQRDGVGAEQLTTAEYTHWPNGNLRQVKDGKGNTTETFYDSAFQAYPVCVKNALGQTTVTRYYGVPGSTDAGCTTSGGSLPWSGGAPVTGKVFGQVEDTTDANSAVTSLAYDAWGRVTQVWRPGEAITQSHSATLIFAYTNYSSPSAPFKVQQRQRDDAQGGGAAATYLESYTFYDGLGQPIQTQAEAAVSNQLLLTQTRYDGVGQVVSQTVPYSATASLGAYQTPNWSQPQAQTVYDKLGRTTTVTNTDGTTVRSYYQGRQAAALDELNRQTIQVSDAFGRLLNSQQYSGTFASPNWGATAYITATYGYTVRDQLSSVVVSDGVTSAITTSSMIYDTVGRKTTLTDADMGTWSYGYDAAGNLTRQTDARGQTLCFYYDALNRLKGKTYRTDINCPTSDPGYAGYTIKYYYDQNANGLGRRTEMQDAAGLTRWQYDGRGRVTLERQSFNGLGFVETGWTYDAADRVQSITYPGGEVVTTTYTSQGLPNALTNQLGGTSGAYVLSTTYDEAGRPASRSLNNGLQTTYAYYAWTTANGRGRLFNIKTTVGAGGAARQDLRYGYDAVGNVTAEADALNVTGGTPGFQRQCFLYDPLNRLQRAWTTAGYCNFTTPNPDTQGAQPYDEAYTYQPNGNLATKGATGSPASYSYGQQAVSCPEGQLAAKPHAVVAVGSDDYCYDQNGNLRRREIWGQTETLSYDAENRHTALSSTDGAQYTFTYDGDGARATATTGTGESAAVTAYAGSLLELERLYGEAFDDGLAQGWTAASGTWAVTSGVYRQSNATASNTNAYRAQTQGQGTYIFRWVATFNSGTSAGFYLFASAATGGERGDSYRIWQDATHVRIYENAGNGATLRASFPAANAAGQTNTYQATYDTRTGQLTVWRAGVYLGSWTDTTPLTSGGYLSLRTDTADVSFDSLVVLSVTKYYYSGGRRIALRRDGSVYYLLTDQLGSTRVTTDESGARAAEMKYYPFGWTRYNSAADIPPLPQKTTYRFTGQRYGPGGGGLYDYGARWYDSTIGRFIQADTIVPEPGNPQALNRYAYVNNNPLRYTDPTGYFSEDELLNKYGVFIGPNQLHSTRDTPETAYWYYLLRAAEVGDTVRFWGGERGDVTGQIVVEEGKLWIAGGNGIKYGIGWEGIGGIGSGISPQSARLAKADGTTLDTEAQLRRYVNGPHSPFEVDYGEASFGGYWGLGGQVSIKYDRYGKWHLSLAAGVGIGKFSGSLEGGSFIQDSPPDPGQIAHALDGWGIGCQGGLPFVWVGGTWPVVNDGPQPVQLGVSSPGLALTVSYTWNLGGR